jgi:4-carboxymuconolactone decarboxylase
VTDGADGPRLRPVPRDEWSGEMVDALRRAFPEPVVERFLGAGESDGSVPTAIATMLHHPALAGPWLAYNNVLLWSPALEHRLRELMVLRVAWRTRSTYEWVQHVKLGERYDVTGDDVVAVTVGPDADRWTPLERDLLAATDQLLDDHCIADDTWARLAAQLDERQLVEVVFVVGTYSCLAMVFNSFGLELDPGLDLRDIPVLPE